MKTSFHVQWKVDQIEMTSSFSCASYLKLSLNVSWGATFTPKKLLDPSEVITAIYYSARLIRDPKTALTGYILCGLCSKNKGRLGLCVLSFSSESNAKLRVHEPRLTLVIYSVIHIKPWVSSMNLTQLRLILTLLTVEFLWKQIMTGFVYPMLHVRFWSWPLLVFPKTPRLNSQPAYTQGMP